MCAGLLLLGFRERTNIALDVMPLTIANCQAFHRHYSRTVLLQLGFKPLFGIVIVVVVPVVVFAIVEQ
jgi:hypothetical protein